MLDYKDIFDQRGKEYHEAMIKYPHARDSEFEYAVALADLSDGQVVCDYPSGGGYLKHYIKQNVDLLALESSETFLGLRTSAKSLLVQNDKIPLADNSVDRFISIAGLHHKDRKEDTFKEVYRCLKPGGKYIIGDVKIGSNAANFLDGFVHKNSSQGHNAKFLTNNTLKQLESCGFKINSHSSVAYTWKFDSKKDISNYFKLLFDLLDKVNQTKIIEAISCHLGNIKIKDKKYCVNWELMFIVAQK